MQLSTLIIIGAVGCRAKSDEDQDFDREAVIVHSESGKCVNFQKKRFFDKSNNDGRDCTKLLVKTFKTKLRSRNFRGRLRVFYF